MIALMALGTTAGRAQGEAVPWQPFAIEHQPAGPETLNLNFSHEAPAGAAGYIRVAHGHLAKPGGERFRIWGVNITAFAHDSLHFPAPEDADFWAGELARMGVNCVRLHAFDVEAPRGILAAGRSDSQHFDFEQLDRMDRFVAALKQRGIYIDLNLNVSRSYKAGDGVRDAPLLGAAKAITYFDPRVVELEKQYARDLLTHYNPYTHTTYASEPAVAIIEILNENSLVGAWVRGRLQGTKTDGPPVNWQDLTPYYADELTRLYNDWLRHSLPESLAGLRKEAGLSGEAQLPRLSPAEFPSASPKRFESEATFYMKVESEFFEMMRNYLRKDLGAQSLLVGTSDFSYGRSDYPALTAAATLDIVDAHGPWESAAMVDEPANSIPVRVSRAAVAGKPFIISEHNHRFPGNYTSEGIPLLAAYAGFQDWDGIFFYSFEMKPRGYHGGIGSRADLSYDPVKLANVAACGPMFLRGDVRPALSTVIRSLSSKQVVQSLLLPESAAGVYFNPGFPSEIALWHGSRVGTLDGGPTQPLVLPKQSPIVTDTGELSWYYQVGADRYTTEDDQKFVARAHATPPHSGVVVIDTPRTQALLGFLRARNVHTAQMTAEVSNSFCCLVLTTLDGKPLARASHLLLSATARVKNALSNSAVTAKATDEASIAGTLIEPVTGKIFLTQLEGAKAAYLIPVDGAGNPMAREEGTRERDTWTFQLGRTVTTSYRIEIARP